MHKYVEVKITFQKLIVPFHYVGPMDGTQVVRTGSGCLYLPRLSPYTHTLYVAQADLVILLSACATIPYLSL